MHDPCLFLRSFPPPLLLYYLSAGITNALSSLMGTFSVYATGLILDASHSWSLVFELVAGFYLIGAASFVTMASAEQQFE
jgi:hypothetical protein